MSDIVSTIKENYINMQRTIERELDIMSVHGGLTGSNREVMWMNFFRKIIPKKFEIEQGVMIMDSTGSISKEVDLVVFDCQYTPYLFQYGEIKFIPIEAVAVVIECKSSNFKSENLCKWSKSISSLRTNPTGIARMVNGHSMSCGVQTQKGTKPIKILASIKNYENENEFTDISKSFDFILYRLNQELKVRVPNEKETLGWWSQKINSGKSNKFEFDSRVKKEYDCLDDNQKNYEVESNGDNLLIKNTLRDYKIGGNPLLSLNFQLNQLLMLINNPMLFPHLAYAKLFE